METGAARIGVAADERERPTGPGGWRKPKKLDDAGLRDYALKLLAGRALSTSELRRRLAARAESAAAVDAVIARLKEYDALDDRRLAENFAVARLENQGLGKARVLRDLRRKRIAPALAEKTVERVFRGTNEAKLVEQYLGRKYKNVRLEELLAVPKNLAAAYRRLRYAGFSGATCIQVLRRYSQQADELGEHEAD